MGTPDTKDTILDAAEELFSEQGFAETSLRQLTARAGVNLAAVNYHFGSKDDLAKAVLLRRIRPINDERRRRLDELPTPATIEQIMRAFLEPVLLKAGDCCGIPRLIARFSLEQPPFLHDLLQEQFAELSRRFIACLAEAAPEVPAESLWWRLHFTVGALAHTLQNGHIVAEVSGGACKVDDRSRLIEHLVAFAVGGMATAKDLR